ncbi:MAG: DNA repair protein RadC [Clostridiales bacterium]|uniref:RadC family protein n=1 Tax=Clostridium sp. N3C TaxID=1776758 RepID=UPI00092E1559|nr:DNA repair protein RadC [Clostridium sp. N3C]NLZ48515.1 DNA repair protein RadC [Clostridiales bacterium]SCN21722.1 DNA repair protein RadC [Clostridium sp. N3C]
MDKAIKIMDLPLNERPRERLFRYGPENLSNSELLAIILRSGSKGENIIELCNRILIETGGLNGLLTSNAQDFMKLKGIKKAKAAQLLALAEISKRFRSYKSGEEYSVNSPSAVADLVMESMRTLKQEVLRIILVNTKNRVILMKDVFVGSLNTSIVHPREVFIEAIKRNAASIIICHNHPSGDPTPSNEDVNITHRLTECGKLIGIQILDHIIIGNGSYISMKEKGIL